MPRIFISYSHAQKPIVEDLAGRLRRIYDHDKVWYDEALTGGEDWWNAILTQIKHCDIFIFLTSDNSLHSASCQDELNEARRLKKPIIPCLVAGFDITNLPNKLKHIQATNISSPITTDEFAELERAIRHQTKWKLPQYVLVAVLILIIGVAVFIFLRDRNPKPQIKLAYEFLVDTSANMLTPLNGVPRYQIVNEAIKQISSVPGLGVSQIWRGVRTAGGNDKCNQTELIAQGNNISPNEFTTRLSQISPSGNNAYEAGINATFEDLSLPEVTASDVKVVFIFLSSLVIKPCRDFYFPSALAAYKQFGIKTTFCTFSLYDDDAGFERFNHAMNEKGFECVHNVDNPEEINQIAVDVIQHEIRKEIGEEEILTPVSSPTSIVYVAATDTSQPTPIITQATASIQTPTPNATQTPDNSLSATPTTESTAEATQVIGDPINLSQTIAPTTPPTDPTSNNLGSTITVKQPTINLRNGPGKNYSIVASAVQGDTFVVTAKNNNPQDIWYLIKTTNGTIAWVSSSVVDTTSLNTQITIALTIPALISAPQSTTSPNSTGNYNNLTKIEFTAINCSGRWVPDNNANNTPCSYVGEQGYIIDYWTYDNTVWIIDPNIPGLEFEKVTFSEFKIIN